MVLRSRAPVTRAESSGMRSLVSITSLAGCRARRGFLAVGSPGRQARVVRQHRADADHDAVGSCPHRVDHRARRGGRGPAGAARRRGDPAVERESQLERRERQSRSPVLEVGSVQLARLIAHQTEVHVDSRLTQYRHAAAGDVRVRVLYRNDDPGDPGREYRVGARRRVAGYGARFERHVERRTGRPRPRLRDGVDLGVGSAVSLVETRPHDLAVTDYHRADDRIGAGRPAAALRQLERPLHVRPVDRLRGRLLISGESAHDPAPPEPVLFIGQQKSAPYNLRGA